MKRAHSCKSREITWKRWNVWREGWCFDCTSSAQIARKFGRHVKLWVSLSYGLTIRPINFVNANLSLSQSPFAGEMCNLLAMTYLQQEDYSLVLELLKKAEILIEKDAAARAATFNNFACYYRRQGKLHSALQYLQKVRIIMSNRATS